MIAEARDGVACVGEEERGVVRLDVVVLRGVPEVIPDEQAVLVGEIVEGFFGVLAHPVADDVHMRVALQAEEGFETLARDALEHVLHAGGAAADGDAHAVDLDDERGLRGEVGGLVNGGRVFAGGGERGDPAEWRLANAFVGFVDERLVGKCGFGGIDFDAAEMAGGVEQGELVGELADAEAECAARPRDFGWGVPMRTAAVRW